MGYSSRYHAASLAAVFLALAIGILIGVGFGDNVLSNTKKNLEASLTGDLEAARSHSDQLAGQLSRSDEFAQRVYPVLVRGELRGRRIGVVALGGLPNDLSTDLEDRLPPPAFWNDDDEDDQPVRRPYRSPQLNQVPPGQNGVPNRSPPTTA